MKKILAILLAISLTGCNKDNKTFTLKTIRLNDYRKVNDWPEKLYLKVLNDQAIPLAQTEGYPNYLILPATFNVLPVASMTLYNRSYTVQLWGDSTGYISSCQINMDDYKIIFPIDMEITNDSLRISVTGSWR